MDAEHLVDGSTLHGTAAACYQGLQGIEARRVTKLRGSDGRGKHSMKAFGRAQPFVILLQDLVESHVVDFGESSELSDALGDTGKCFHHVQLDDSLVILRSLLGAIWACGM